MQNNQQQSIGVFEKNLHIWVAISIMAGVFLGNFFPKIFAYIATLEYANVNLVIAVFIWAMIYPMMIGIDFYSLKNVAKKPKCLIITIIINWLVKPFTMVLFGALFLQIVFKSFISAEDARQYLAGLILLGVAPCTAMVFVWSKLVKGDSSYILVQVSLNDIIMIFAFAPIASFLLGVSGILVPWSTLIISVVFYIILPLIAGFMTRASLQYNKEKIDNFTNKIKPFSIIGLLFTVLFLFALQAEKIVHNPLIILLVSVPIIIQGYFIFALTYYLNYFFKVPFALAAPSAFIGTSNFFELAVAIAIGLFGLNSLASLATVVGVLVEVPLMLSLVYIANKTRSYFK